MRFLSASASFNAFLFIIFLKKIKMSNFVEKTIKIGKYSQFEAKIKKKTEKKELKKG